MGAIRPATVAGIDQSRAPGSPCLSRLHARYACASMRAPNTARPPVA